MTENMAVILTAFNLEYEAVRRQLVDVRQHWHDKGTLFEIGRIRGAECRVALGLTGKGNHPAAVLAERAIQHFSPVAVLFVGVAGALWDTTSLGDVVVATHVYAYHGGTSEDDGAKARPRVWEVAHEVSQLASHLARMGDWIDGVATGVRVPKVHFGAIAAGEVVQNSRISYEANWIRKHYNDAIAIEMEAAGVTQAGHLNGSPVAIVRGISDKADGSKSTKGDSTWQPQAAENAAAFAVRLADALIKERGSNVMRESDSAKNGDVINTVISGQVGIQARNVTGSPVYMGTVSQVSTVKNILTELAEIRDQLKRERAAGNLDEATYRAAQEELDVASKALEGDTAEGKKKFVLALKKLRGLIADAADLAAKTATLIAAANGLA